MTTIYGLPKEDDYIEDYFTVVDENTVFEHPGLGTIRNISAEQMLSAGRFPVVAHPGYDKYTQRLGSDKLHGEVIYKETLQLTQDGIDQLLADTKSACQSQLSFGYERTMTQLTEGYSEFERDTFDKQEEEARKWLPGYDDYSPLLMNIALARGIDVSELVPLVIENADLFILNAGLATGHRQLLRDSIEAAQTPQEAESYTW